MDFAASMTQPNDSGNSAILRHMPTGWLLTVICALPLSAAEVHFRPRVTVHKPLVTLGDVAEIVTSGDAEAAALAATELFPAPATGRPRLVPAREIRDLLAIRAVNLASVRFGGASVVRICRATPPSTAASPEPPLDRTAAPVVAAEVEAEVAAAIREHLRQTVAPEAPWTVRVHLSNSVAERLSGHNHGFTVTGGQPPWSGSQRFVLSFNTDGRAVNVPVVADVSRPVPTVVAARAVPAGRVIQASDVRVEHKQPSSRSAVAASRLEDVIGKQTTRALTAGYPIDHRAIRAPILVRRGEVVTVIVRVANVKVTTHARAMEEGGQGDLIEVQSLSSRERYVAQVVGIQQVAVYPRRVQVAASESHPGRQPPRAGHELKSEQPLVAVGNVSAGGTAAGWTRRRTAASNAHGIK
jgi:flagella basal body P-ring formation protein FlgA